MDYFVSVLLDVFCWSKLSSTERTVTTVAWFVVFVLIFAVVTVVALNWSKLPAV